jgi:predicted DNA-binding protein with PD1-like motif
MKFRADGYNWIVRLDKGEKLVESLTRLVKAEKIPSCWVSGLGGALNAELGFYDLQKKEYQWHNFDELMEITNLQGNLAWDGEEPQWHIHGTLSKSDASAIGGHIKELTVGGTCEVLLHRWYKENLTRTKDDEIGLNLLDL